METCQRYLTSPQQVLVLGFAAGLLVLGSPWVVLPWVQVKVMPQLHLALAQVKVIPEVLMLLLRLGTVQAKVMPQVWTLLLHLALAQVKVIPEVWMRQALHPG